MKIRELRLESGKTQSNIAELLNISRQVYANYENEINFPDPKMLAKIADVFGVTVDYLLGREEPVRELPTTPANTLTAEEEELLRIFRNASRGGKNILLGNARSVEKNDEYLKKRSHA